jgi:hypothetical protein
MPILQIVIGLVIICLLWWAITTVTAAFGLPAPIQTVIMVVFVILVVLWLISLIGGIGFGGGNLNLGTRIH